MNGTRLSLKKLTSQNNRAKCPKCQEEISKSTVKDTTKHRVRTRVCGECQYVFYTKEIVLGDKEILINTQNKIADLAEESNMYKRMYEDLLKRVEQIAPTLL